MSADNKKTVSMTFGALYSYILNTNYRCISGGMGLFISVMSLAYFVAGYNNLTHNRRIIFLLLGLLFTVINPAALAFKTFRQLKLSASYKRPLIYNFTDEGIEVEQGEQKMTVKWNKVCRVLMTWNMVAIYTSRMHAFVIPLKALGEDRAKILTMVVQFSDVASPVLSKNLEGYKSGKGYNA